MIADDFAAIARRLGQIAKERQRGRFVLPAGVIIVPRTKLYPGMPIPNCEVCLVLDDKVCSLLLIAEGSRTTLSKPFGMQLLEHLAQFCPSVRAINAFEARLSHDDTKTLMRLLEGV
jgi:hypothetical protein